MATKLEEELLKFLRAQADADVIGKLARIEEAQDRLYNLFVRQGEEHKATIAELRGEMRGLSLRISEVERGHARLDVRATHLEKASDSHADLIIADLEGDKKEAVEQVTFLRRNALGIVATLLAVASTIYHFFRK